MRPAFSIDVLRELTRSLYGMDPVFHALPSYSDQNLALAIDGKRVAVLKIANSDEPDAVLALQVDALRHLQAHAPALSVPRACPTKDGAYLTAVDDPSTGERHRLWMVTFIEGRPMAACAPHPARRRAGLGDYFGRLDRALRPFTHPAMHRSLRWDLKQAGGVRGYLADIDDDRGRDGVAAVLDRFDAETAGALDAVRAQVVHNDGNDHNVLVAGEGDAERVTGVIDFGDMVHTALVCEPAIAASYALLGTDDPLGAALEVVAGYHLVNPLTRDECVLAFDLILLRLSMSVSYSARERALEPDNAYLAVSEAPAWEALRRLTALDRGAAQARFAAIAA